MGAYFNSVDLVKCTYKILLIYNYVILISPVVSSLKEVSYFDDQSYKSVDVAPPKVGWVDPFDMLPPSDNLIVQSDVDNYILSNRLKKYESYSRRFVNLFLRAVTATPKEEAALIDSDKFVKLEFFISGKNLLLLRDFGENGENNGAKLETVSDILDAVFSQNSGQVEYSYSFLSFWRWITTSFDKLSKSPEWTVVSSVVLLILVTLWFARTHSYCLAFFFLFLTVFVCGFGFTWIRMYEEKEVEKYVNLVINGDVPPHCTGNSLPLHKHMYYKMFGADCYEFYKIRDVRTFVKISPTDVFAETLSSMIINPATNIGKAYGNFISSLKDSVSIWLSPFAVIFGFILPPILFVLFLCFLFGFNISAGLTGISLMPSSFRRSQPLESRESARYIEDMSKESLKNNGNENLLTENKKPLFIAMNWNGFQKLMSGSNTADDNDGGNGQEALTVANKGDSQKSEERNIQVIADVGESEDSKVSPESKSPANCRRKSKGNITSTEHPIPNSSKTENEDENLNQSSSDKCNVPKDKTANIKEELS